MLALACVAIAAVAAPPPALRPAAYTPLRLGSFNATGWLLRQLRTQAHSLSGHLSLFWKDVRLATPPHTSLPLSALPPRCRPSPCPIAPSNILP